MKKSLWICAVLAMTVFNQTTHAEPAQKPYLMGAIGNSITAGALAAFPRPDFTPMGDQSSLPEMIRRLLAPLIESKDTYSWASGENIESHFVRLRRIFEQEGADLKVRNLAVSGSHTEDIIRQAEQLVKSAESGEFESLKYVTVLIGVNDICSKSSTLPSIPEASLRQIFLSMYSALSRIRQSEPIKILVSSLPRIPDLGLPENRDARTFLGIRCETIRDDILKSCNSLISWSSEQDHLTRLNAVQQVNSIIRDTAAQASSQFPQLEIHYGDGLFNSPITPDLLAIDCYHPNSKGQEKISDALWTDQTWFSELPVGLR